MKFTKMHGIGNDYVYVNCLEETVHNPAETARFVSDRHFGIGSDGLVLIGPSQTADFEMAMYNADGSRGEMCGNAIRCVAKYVYEHHMTDRTRIRIETLAGIKEVELDLEQGCVASVHVDMGRPEFAPERIPVNLGTKEPDGRIVGFPLTVGETPYPVTCVSMGNPHCVVFMDDVDALAIETIGPQFEHHPAFPNRVNTEFVTVLSRDTVRMRVWERGSAETLACGTGACAAAVAAVLNGYTSRSVTVKLRGGDLRIVWDKETGAVTMSGPAQSVFEGDIVLPHHCCG